jgi:hypothetical protein
VSSKAVCVVIEVIEDGNDVAGVESKSEFEVAVAEEDDEEEEEGG